jgi:hypothetical protein
MYQWLNTTRNHQDHTANVVFSHFRSYSKIKKSRSVKRRTK